MKGSRCFWNSLLFFFLTAAIYPVSAEKRSANLQEFKYQLFVETVHILGGFNGRVARWSDDIRIAVVGKLGATAETKLITLIAQLSLYTGLNIKRVKHNFKDASDYLHAISLSPAHDLTLCSRGDSSECANFVVIVTSQAVMFRITENLPMRSVYQRATAGVQDLNCFFSPHVSRDFEIQKTVIFVNSNLTDEMLNTCLQEEIVQALGLFNDYSDSHFYSFNNIVSPKQLTVHDRILLCSLYDRAYSIGSLAAPIAQQVVDYSVKYYSDRKF